jgi:hypothetical protein
MGEQRWVLPSGASATIGRDDASDIQIVDPAVSRRHAIMEWSSDGWILIDLQSERTFLGGRRVDRVVIATRVVVRLGGPTAGHPVIAVIALQWIARLVRRVGGLPALLRHGVRPVSFLVHQFMDAADVAPAWELMQRGEKATDPRVLAAQQRLAACHYAMAHPDSGELVPACVQHGVLDGAPPRFRIGDPIRSRPEWRG